jgi:hypothetical protein
MQKTSLLSLAFVLAMYGFSFELLSQNTSIYRLDFAFSDSVPLIVGNDTLSLAWAGGIDQGQFVEIDLNLNGRMDLLGFDRKGDRYIPLIKEGDSGSFYYRYDHERIKYLPPAQHYIQVADYNCDGKMDILTVGGLGTSTCMIYENTSAGGQLSFQQAIPGPYLYYTNAANRQFSIFINSTDIPVFQDVNRDGAIDILSFDVLGGIVTYYKNKQLCGIDFEIETYCYGDFMESFMGNNITLFACSGSGGGNVDDHRSQIESEGRPENVMHAESSLLSLDLTGNGLYDLIIGDSDYPGLIGAFNNGSLDTALMTTKDTTFPVYNIPAHMPNFPAAFYIDVDHDGVRDLLVTSNSKHQGMSDSSVHFYKNIGLDTLPNFSLQNRRLFQEEMIELGTNAFPVICDFNGDGLPDILVGNYGYSTGNMNEYRGNLFLFENIGSVNQPVFKLIDSDFANMSQYNKAFLYPTVYDLDNDGDYDIVLGSEDGELIYLENTGSSTTPQWATPVFNYQNINVTSKSAPALFDVTGDGKPELFVGNDIGHIAYFENTGTASNPSFSLVTPEFSGIQTRRNTDTEGNAMPSFYKMPTGEIQFIVGTFNQGVLVYDSIETVLNLPQIANIDIGTGNEVLSTPELSALGAARRNGRNQFIIRAAELYAEGIYSGNFSSIAFDITSTNNPSLSQGFRISMRSIPSGADFSNGWLTPGANNFEGTWALSLGYNTIPFNRQSFEWDGTSDILIQVCFSRNSNIFQNINMRGTQMSEQLNAYPLNDNASGNNTLLADGCALPLLSTSNLRPNFRFAISPALLKSNQFLKSGQSNAVALIDLDGDSLPEAILGNMSGGLQFFKGIMVEVDTVNDSLSVQRYVQQSVHKSTKVFPNPTNHGFYIDFSDDETIPEVQLFSLGGVQIRKWNNVVSKEQIDLPTLSSGVYLVRILTPNGKWEHHRLTIIQ